MNHYFPLRPESVYFHYTASNLNPSDNTRFEGITIETTSVIECLRCLRCSCLHHVQFVTRFLVANSWDARNPGAPHHLLHASAHFSFASVSQSSYRNRNVAVAPFRYRRRGTPFVSAMMTNCFIMRLSTLNKNCLNLHMSSAS